jgi:hypothetical protein
MVASSTINSLKLGSKVTTLTQGGGSAISSMKNLADAKALAPVIGMATKFIGVVGAGLSITDAVVSWVVPNPVRSECEENRNKFVQKA